MAYSNSPCIADTKTSSGPLMRDSHGDCQNMPDDNIYFNLLVYYQKTSLRLITFLIKVGSFVLHLTKLY